MEKRQKRLQMHYQGIFIFLFITILLTKQKNNGIPWKITKQYTCCFITSIISCKYNWNLIKKFSGKIQIDLGDAKTKKGQNCIFLRMEKLKVFEVRSYLVPGLCYYKLSKWCKVRNYGNSSSPRQSVHGNLGI